MKLIYALNAIAATLQESIQSEETVYEVFQNQVVALGCAAASACLMKNEEDIAFQDRGTFQFAEKNASAALKRSLKITADGYSVPVDRWMSTKK